MTGENIGDMKNRGILLKIRELYVHTYTLNLWGRKEALHFKEGVTYSDC